MMRPFPLARSVSLEQLAILNTEMAALVQAGIPLHQGLLEYGNQTPGALGSVSRSIAERLSRGEELQDILRDSRSGVPEVYAAVLEAGIRAGRLAVALQGIASALRNTIDLRRSLRIAWIYPLIVSVVAYAGIIIIWHTTIPLILEMVNDLRQPRMVVFDVLQALRDPPPYFWCIPPLGLLSFVMFRGWRNRNRIASGAAHAGGRPSSIQRYRELVGLALFNEILALLIEQQHPLAESLILSGRASGEPRIARAAWEWAEQLRVGHTVASCSLASPIPSFIRFSLARTANTSIISATLRAASRSYRERALELQSQMRFFYPIVLLVVVGGIAIMMFSLLSFAPWFLLLEEIGKF